MTGLALLASVALLWFCYAAIGAVVALGGDEHLPRVLKPLLEPASHPTRAWTGRFGAVIVAALWLTLAFAPQAALIREIVMGRAGDLDTLAIMVDLSGSVLWLGFLGWRYRQR